MVSTKLEKALLTFLPPNLPVDGFYSSLTHGSHQRPLAWSKRNMAIVPSWVPDKRAPGLMNPSIRMLSLLMCAEGKARLWDTAMEDISMFHGQSILTHILWNHSGNFFASIDEKGKIAIWANKKYLNTWLPIYTVEMHNPVICCEWINPDRMYVATEDPSGEGVRYGRERTIWSRNSLALVLLTSDGQLVAIHKPNGHYFTHIVTSLPPRSGTEDQISSRISHGAMISDAMDGIQLATHCCNSLPSTVNVYQIHLRFTPEVMFRCDAKAILYLSNPLTGQGSLMAPSVLHHLQWLPKTSSKPFSIAVALADRNVVDEGSNDLATTVHYRSQIVVWDMVVKVVSFHSAFHDLSTRRSDANTGQAGLTFVVAGEHQFMDKFVSTMTCIQRTRELVVGFSDGSIVGLDSQSGGGLSLAKRTHLSGFSGSKVRSPPVTLHSSPNGLCLMVLYLCGRISTLNLVPPKVAAIAAETSATEATAAAAAAAATATAVAAPMDVETLAQIAILAIVNEWDYTDVIAKVTMVTRSTNDPMLADRLLERMFRSLPRIAGAEESTMNDCAFLPQTSLLRRMLAFQMVLFQSLPNKRVQFRATSALLQLFSLGEIFMGSCTSDPTTLAAHMDLGPLSSSSSSAAGSTTTPTTTTPPMTQPPLQSSPKAVHGHQQQHLTQLKFDKDTVWSLLPLAGWTLELCTVLFRELAMFLNIKKSHQESRSRAASQDFSMLMMALASPGGGLAGGSSTTTTTAAAAAMAAAATTAAATAATTASHPAHTPTILCLLYHARARRTLRNLLTLIEQYHLYLKNREQLYMRVIKTGGPVEATPGGVGGGVAGAVSAELQGMTIAEAFAMREIQITTLFQHVDSLVTRCPLKIGVVKSFLRDLGNIGPGSRPGNSAGSGGGAGHGTGPNANLPATGGGAGSTAAGGQDGTAIWQEQSVLVKGVVPPAVVAPSPSPSLSAVSTMAGTAAAATTTTTTTTTLAQARTELQMMTRRYPTLWEMNRLMFATIHWLDLEPAPAIVYPTRISRRQKLAAIHPSRSRMDAVATIRNRMAGAAAAAAAAGGGGIGGRPGGPSTYSSRHYNVPTPQPTPDIQMGPQSSYMGSRSNSISSGPKTGGGYTESPAELPLGQQSNATQPFAQAFARRASTMAAGGPGPLDAVAPPSVPAAATTPAFGSVGALSFWGQEHRFDGWSENDNAGRGGERGDGDDNDDDDDGDDDDDDEEEKDDSENAGGGRGVYCQVKSPGEGGDAWEDDGYVDLQQIESADGLESDGGDDEVGEEEDEDDEDEEEVTGDAERRATGAQPALGEDIELPSVVATTTAVSESQGREGGVRSANGRRATSSSSSRPLANGMLFFSAKAQEVATRTLPAWTVFARLETAQILDDERNVVRGVLLSSGNGGGGPASMSSPYQLSFEAYFDEMSRVEAQSRKRQLGVDWIRKSKRYKTSNARGRRCIRCLQMTTTTGGGGAGASGGGGGGGGGGGPAVGSTALVPPQTPGATGPLGPGGLAGQDITAKTLWYHNYDRSCICGGMWLEL
ncbi:hypothetical protein DFQ27_001580 [Actinomortierella ambigua]|uniref:Mediator complex subunit 16 n=1 Tax=Actinomortierella ambigua TaxID=1343610 RepID=A0A9P6QBV4_9FUNG|nr:hypothetical protein DFQ27_001580 [Actinomortierella ambigua]